MRKMLEDVPQRHDPYGPTGKRKARHSTHPHIDPIMMSSIAGRPRTEVHPPERPIVEITKYGQELACCTS
jgi:hypothetical protein